MQSKDKKSDRLPEEFASTDQAGEFWDTHEITEYKDSLEPVELEVSIKERRFEIEVDEELLMQLKERASKMGVSVAQLVCQYLRDKLKAAA